jgi:hypothetical protein
MAKMAVPACPQCKAHVACRVDRPGLLGALFRVVGVHSFHCGACDRHFRAFQQSNHHGPGGQERRKQDRILVRFVVVFSGKQLQGKGTVLNLSLDGCQIEADTLVPVDTVLNLGLFASEQSKPVEIAGIVRSANDKRIGVRFLRVSNQEGLLQFLRHPETGGPASKK